MRVNTSSSTVPNTSASNSTIDLSLLHSNVSRNGGGTRSFSSHSLSNKIWDFFSSSSNPIMDVISSLGYLDYARIRPDHIVEAAEECQSRYDMDLKSIETKIQEGYYETNSDDDGALQLLRDMQEMVHPLLYIQNVICLLSMVKYHNKDSKQSLTKFALGDAMGKIQFHHEASTIIYSQLKKMKEQLVLTQKESSLTVRSKEKQQEYIRAVQFLLQKQEVNGTNLQVEQQENGQKYEISQELSQLTSHIFQLETKFLTLSSLTLEEHGKVTSPRELIPYMYEITSLKQRKARLLGYENYAVHSLKVHNSMAKDVDSIRDLHHQFISLSASDSTMDEKEDSLLRSEDFISKQLSIVSNDSFAKNISDYFELEHVLTALFNLSSSLFGVRIVEESNPKLINGWHADVRLFHVYDTNANASSLEKGRSEDEEPKKIASFYLDAFRRQNKDSGAFVMPMTYRYTNAIATNIDENESNGDNINVHHAEGVKETEGTTINPVVAISLNIRPPAWNGDPVPLELEDVVTLYHEFGHALQNMLVKVDMGTFLGAQCIEEDASEVMSQLMEYFLFQKSVLTRISKHKETGEPLSLELIDAIKEWRRANKVLELTHRLFLGELELQVNSEFDPSGDSSLVALQRTCAEQYCPHQKPPKGNIDPLIEVFQNNAKGKLTAQYRYLWSEVISTDIFEALVQEASDEETQNIDQQERELAQRGRKFRHNFLEKGSSMSTKDMHGLFKGGKADLQEVLKMYGFV